MVVFFVPYCMHTHIWVAHLAGCLKYIYTSNTKNIFYEKNNCACIDYPEPNH
jgi:hypothetical protein